MFLKPDIDDSEFLQYHCLCTTSPVTGQTTCVCTDGAVDHDHTNFSPHSLASTAGVLCGSCSVDPNQFMFRGSFFGQSINVLVDTGATTSFISKSFVDQH
jgi:hypothetical protein